MRISKGIIVALSLGIILIGAGTLYMLWQEEVDRGDSISANLDTAQALLPIVSNGVTAAEADLAAAQAGLTAAQAKLAVAQANLAEFIDRFPTPPPQAAVQTIDYGTRLFILASNNSLNLTEFRADDFSSVTIDKIKYQQTSMEINVTGIIENINHFIGNLETANDYLTATIDSVSINFFTEFDTELGAVPPPEAVISITILALES